MFHSTNRRRGGRGKGRDKERGRVRGVSHSSELRADESSKSEHTKESAKSSAGPGHLRATVVEHGPDRDTPTTDTASDTATATTASTTTAASTDAAADVTSDAAMTNNSVDSSVVGSVDSSVVGSVDSSVVDRSGHTPPSWFSLGHDYMLWMAAHMPVLTVALVCVLGVVVLALGAVCVTTGKRGKACGTCLPMWSYSYRGGRRGIVDSLTHSAGATNKTGLYQVRVDRGGDDVVGAQVDTGGVGVASVRDIDPRVFSIEFGDIQEQACDRLIETPSACSTRGTYGAFSPVSQPAP